MLVHQSAVWQLVILKNILTYLHEHKSGSASIFALKTLKNHGASADSLQLITRATIIARTMYASPAWWGLASEKDKSRIERLNNRLKRSGFIQSDSPSTNVLANKADTVFTL